MIDAEITSLLHLDPLLRHRLEALPTLSIYNIDHGSLVKSDDSREIDSFAAYVSLQQITASIHRARALFPDDPSALVRTNEALLKWWYQCKATCYVPPQDDTLQLRILLSSTHMMCQVDMDKLERAIGRDGPLGARECLPYVRSWATSPKIWRCVAYAMVTLDETEHMRLGSEPALHVARAVFQAGLVLLSFSALGDKGSVWHAPGRHQGPPVDLVESALDDLFAQSLGRRRDADARTFISLSGARAMVSRCADMLSRLRRWDLSGRLSDLLVFLADRSASLFEDIPA